MLSFLKKLFGAKPAETTAEAPYKVEAQTVVAVGEPPATVVVEGAGVVESPAKKAKAKKTGATKKPATAKKPRTPKAK
jgi:hypothetical protein